MTTPWSRKSLFFPLKRRNKPTTLQQQNKVARVSIKGPFPLHIGEETWALFSWHLLQSFVSMTALSVLVIFAACLVALGQCGVTNRFSSGKPQYTTAVFELLLTFACRHNGSIHVFVKKQTNTHTFFVSVFRLAPKTILKCVKIGEYKQKSNYLIILVLHVKQSRLLLWGEKIYKTK